MIEIHDLTFTYSGSGSPALENINLRVAGGEFVGISGPAGAGKTTLALCINGVIPHFMDGSFHGTVIVDGYDTASAGCKELACSVGSVFQDPESQIVFSTVEEEIAFGLENLNIPRKEMVSRIDESLKMVGISHLKRCSTSHLSGGQKQRVAIASAIALKPKVLILDEPTSELDPQGSMEVFKTLENLNSNHNITVVVIEQKIQLLSEFCQRLVIMDKGKIMMDGPVKSILSNREVLNFLGIDSFPVAKLMHLIRDKGLYDGEFPVNIDEAFDIISYILKPKILH